MQLAQITQIEKLANLNEITPFHAILSRPVVTDIIKTVVNQYRQYIIENKLVVDNDQLLNKIIASLQHHCKLTIQPVINATGILVHTNLGRSPIPQHIWQQAGEMVCRYTNLELNLANGKRGNRMGMLSRILSAYFGGESNLIVNNNAAAMLLVLKAFAQGKEVIVSRGEQVQIGGGFRIPEILAESGAILRDVGTTNITTLDDYLNAINENTAMVLVVHQSNYYIEGFSQSVNIKQLASRLPKHVKLVVDQGSGNELKTLTSETTVSSYLKAGADLVCCSGDKMVGGPQSGIILGKKELVEQLAKHPMMRVFRPGKETYVLLEKLLVHRLNRDNDHNNRIETILEQPIEWHKQRAQQLVDIAPTQLNLVESEFLIGGGTTPRAKFATWAVEINTSHSSTILIEHLRQHQPSIIGVIKQDKVLIYPVTLFDDELPIIEKYLKQLTQNS